jgi:DNA-binding transcriptional regulator YiaG
MATVITELRDLIASGRARALRDSAGISQTDAGRDLRVDPSTIHHWEMGTRTPRGANAVAYHRYLRRLARVVEAAR